MIFLTKVYPLWRTYASFIPQSYMIYIYATTQHQLHICFLYYNLLNYTLYLHDMF